MPSKCLTTSDSIRTKNASDLNEILALSPLNLNATDETCSSRIITCSTCNYYMRTGNPDSHIRKSLGGTFAAGMFISREKFDIIKEGNKSTDNEKKKVWKNFKKGVIDHLSSSLHETATLHEEKQQSLQSRSEKVTGLLVKTTLSSVSAKIAARHFTPMLSMMSSLSFDIGDIGHSR